MLARERESYSWFGVAEEGKREPNAMRRTRARACEVSSHPRVYILQRSIAWVPNRLPGIKVSVRLLSNKHSSFNFHLCKVWNRVYARTHKALYQMASPLIVPHHEGQDESSQPPRWTCPPRRWDRQHRRSVQHLRLPGCRQLPPHPSLHDCRTCSAAADSRCI